MAWLKRLWSSPSHAARAATTTPSTCGDVLDLRRVSSPLAVDDLFVAGVGCDVVASFLLARGLVTSPSEISARSASTRGSHAATAVALARDRADAQAGLITLIAGFALQLIGYLLSIGGVGPGRDHSVGVAVGIGVISMLVSATSAETTRGRRVRRCLVRVASCDPVTSAPALAPDVDRLMSFGIELGEKLRMTPGHEAPRAFVARTFRVSLDGPAGIRPEPWRPGSPGKGVLIEADSTAPELRAWRILDGRPLHIEGIEALALPQNSVTAFLEIDSFGVVTLPYAELGGGDRLNQILALDSRLQAPEGETWDFS